MFKHYVNFERDLDCMAWSSCKGDNIKQSLGCNFACPGKVFADLAIDVGLKSRHMSWKFKRCKEFEFHN